MGRKQEANCSQGAPLGTAHTEGIIWITPCFRERSEGCAVRIRLLLYKAAFLETKSRPISRHNVQSRRNVQHHEKLLDWIELRTLNLVRRFLQQRCLDRGDIGIYLPAVSRAYRKISGLPSKWETYRPFRTKRLNGNDSDDSEDANRAAKLLGVGRYGEFFATQMTGGPLFMNRAMFSNSPSYFFISLSSHCAIESSYAENVHVIITFPYRLRRLPFLGYCWLLYLTMI